MASSSSTTPNVPEESFTAMENEKDATLTGSHCQYTYCHQLDFLPFRCESCRGTFCLDHRTETAHHCAQAGEWAARRRRAHLATPSLGAGKPLLSSGNEAPQPCASPACKTVIGSSLAPSVHCATCNRSYCLAHRLKEEHNCKNLIPVGARPASQSAVALQAERARLAFGKLKAWGSAQKQAAVAAAGGRVLPRARPSSAAARLGAVNELKKSAKGDEKLGPEKRVYLFVEAEAATTTAKFPRGQFFYSKEWVVGRLLDAAAKSLQVQNVNNQGTDEKEKLRVFHVEGGRLLEFSEKVGTALVSGNTVVLLRGVGPAVPDLIEA